MRLLHVSQSTRRFRVVFGRSYGTGIASRKVGPGRENVRTIEDYHHAKFGLDTACQSKVMLDRKCKKKLIFW